MSKPNVNLDATELEVDTQVEEADTTASELELKEKPKKLRISYERKKGLYGYGFISLWLIGTIYFFIIPIVKSIYYSFHKTQLEAGKLDLTFIGLDNFNEALFKSPTYIPALSASLTEVWQRVIIIVIFSLFIAVLLNQKFKGRVVARAIFFLPVIIATGPVIGIINGDMVNQGVQGAEQFNTLFETDLVGKLMEFIGIYNISEQLTDTIQTITSDIFNLVWNSGVQILIFLAALQTIPTAAREAAEVEGATAWEYFWKITFPYVSPMILANIIYTVIDCFTDPNNEVMRMVVSMKDQWNFGYMSAIAWIYFAIVGVALAIVILIVSKLVHYEVD